jgi:peptidoglycan/xylan/chitin deacetylase (PgdA/CDA1 family)
MTSGPQVTLTFDNGPWPGVTDRVLDLLADRDVKATFFVVGRELSAPDAGPLARRAVAEGHWIGNHTWSHRVPFGDLGDDLDAVADEVERTQELIGDLAHADRLFRPFGEGGHLDARLLGPAAVRHLEAGGYTCVLWDCVPRDWEDPAGWVDRCLDDVLQRDRSVVVLHDLPTGAMDHLDRLLDGIEAGGASCVQDFPDHCVAMRRGKATPVLDGVVAGT